MAINSLKLGTGAKNKYVIMVSGKGQPYIDFEEHISIDHKALQNFKRPAPSILTFSIVSII